MKALYYQDFGAPIHLEDLPDPSADHEGVVVRVMASGLCRSDWHGWMGHDRDIVLPHVPGHELVGEVVETGKYVKKVSIGDRVTVPFVSGCGKCPECRSGNQQVCDAQFQPGFTAWGSFSELVALRYADLNVVKVPEEIATITAVSLGCRFVSAFRALMDVAGIRREEWIAIHGCGGVGLSAVMIGSAMDCRVIAVDIDHQSLELATSLGADHVIDVREEDPVEKINSITNGGVHVSIDALGSGVTCRNSILSLRKQGRHVQVGLLAGEDADPQLPMHEVIAKELVLMGSHGMQSSRYDRIFDLIGAGKLNPGALVTKTISLDQAGNFLMRMNADHHPGVTVIDTF